jgi:hypothetical protein
MNIVKCCLIGENVLGKKNVNRISELCYVILCGFGLGGLRKEKKKKKKNYSGFLSRFNFTFFISHGKLGINFNH